VKLCPVDLAACDRAYCCGGHCELAESRHLVVCWECGKLEENGIVHGICVECVTVTAAPAHAEE
jgi:hypothetical protein